MLDDGRMRTPEAAKYLGYKTGTLNNMRVTGTGPEYYDINGRIFYKKEDLDFWVSNFGKSRSTAQARIRRLNSGV